MSLFKLWSVSGVNVLSGKKIKETLWLSYLMIY